MADGVDEGLDAVTTSRLQGEQARSTPADRRSTLTMPAGDSSLPPLPADRYDNRGKLARGGMADIYEVFDKLILRRVAMKTLRGGVSSSDLAARFLEEAQITGQLDHPNIVPVYDVGRDESGRPDHFLMKLIQGSTLEEVFSKLDSRALSGPELERVLQVFLKVCDAVAFAHSRGVIHRDLKPSNIMVGDYGQVYVMDWGVAVLDGSQSHAEAARDERDANPVMTARVAEQRGALSGTPAYMAPEQAWGRTDEIDVRTDVFGLGAILYELLTARAPHDTGDADRAIAAARAGEITPPQEARPDVELPPGLCRITTKALSAEPAERYPSVLALKQEIEAFLRGGGWLETRIYEAGTAIVRQGEAAHAAFVIQSGHCRVSRSVDGTAVLLRELGPGDVFGETAIFSDSPRTADVYAVDDVNVMVVTRQAFEKELSRTPWLHAFVRALSDRFVDATDKLTATAGKL